MSVSDNGSGIDSKVLARLGEPFFTTKTTEPAFGLTVVKAVTRAHQGELQLRLRPGRGTCAQVILPLFSSASGSGGSQDKAIKVLLVEDDRKLREALADTLLLAGTITRLSVRRKRRVVAVVSSRHSIWCSVTSTCRAWMAINCWDCRARQSQLPVLLMTAHGAVERAVDAMRQGAVDYLVKPFEPKALLDLVRHALGSLGAPDRVSIALERRPAQLLELAARVARSDSTVPIARSNAVAKGRSEDHSGLVTPNGLGW